MAKQKGGARFAPKGPQGVRYKKYGAGGRLVGTTKGGGTDQQDQGNQPVAKQGFKQAKNKYKMGQ